MVVQVNPAVLADQFKNLRPGRQAMRTGQGPEQVEVNLGLSLRILRCPRLSCRLPAER